MIRIAASLVLILAAAAMAGLVKRDAVDDIGDSINELKEGGFCMLDSDCMEPLQTCNRENPLKMHCEFVVWVWVGLGVAAGVLLLSVLGTCLCCSCCCLSSLCRKS